MASRLAQRRAAKAVRRKKILKARHATAPASLADRMRHMAAWPLYRCLLHGPIEGMSNVFLARKSPTGEIAMAAFLVDAYALGIKDVFFELVEMSEFEAAMARESEDAPMTPVDPSYARKLVRQAAAYAASLGLRPHRGFAAIEQLFGDARAEDCAATFTFGLDGKPVYAISPLETPEQIARRVRRLSETLGPEGFELAISMPETASID